VTQAKSHHQHAFNRSITEKERRKKKERKTRTLNHTSMQRTQARPTTRREKNLWYNCGEKSSEVCMFFFCFCLANVRSVSENTTVWGEKLLSVHNKQLRTAPPTSLPSHPQSSGHPLCDHYFLVFCLCTMSRFFKVCCQSTACISAAVFHPTCLRVHSLPFCVCVSLLSLDLSLLTSLS
jgi:hypothetical protein